MFEPMGYYINLFTAETWREARENARFAFTGHREGARNRDKVKPGDIFLCYVTQTSAFVGAEKVMSDVYEVRKKTHGHGGATFTRFVSGRDCSFASPSTKAFGSKLSGNRAAIRPSGAGSTATPQATSLSLTVTGSSSSSRRQN